MARRAVWTRAKHRSGLERPHFVATETVAVAPAHKLNRGFVRGVFCWGEPRDSGGAAQGKGIRTFVRQYVTQNCKGGANRKHGNHQGTTQTTKISDDPGASGGVGENAARSICRIHRLHSVLRHCGGSESLVQTRRRVQSLVRATRQGPESRTDPRRGSHKDRMTNMKSRPTQFGVRENTASSRRHASRPTLDSLLLDDRGSPERFATSTANSSLGILRKRAGQISHYDAAGSTHRKRKGRESVCRNFFSSYNRH